MKFNWIGEHTSNSITAPTSAHPSAQSLVQNDSFTVERTGSFSDWLRGLKAYVFILN
jgi:hypothetical protein